jgi:flavodoxin
MKVEYFHASVHGNGAKVAEEFRARMAEKGVHVNVHHVDDVEPTNLPPADLYAFSSPGRMGKPIKDMRKFLERLELPKGTKYALLTTESPPKPNKDGTMPPEAETCRWQRVRPIMNEILQGKGCIKVAENKVYVMEIKGPLEDGWQKKVAEFAAIIVQGGAVA